MRAVVTGGLGFVGRHLVDHLRDEGDDVVTLDRNGDHPVDITDGPAVTAALAEAAPDAVYHLAGWADVGASWSDPVGVLRVNAEGTLNVLRACTAAGVGRVLAVASADVYGVVHRGRAPARRRHRPCARPARTPPRSWPPTRSRSKRSSAMAWRGPRAPLQPPGPRPIRAVRGARASPHASPGPSTMA